MHDLFTKVLSNRDLSRAGDLFSVADIEILPDLSDVLREINKIISQSSYLTNTNDQSVIEICIARCLQCIRDSGKAEQYCVELVKILETCLFMSALQLSSTVVASSASSSSSSPLRHNVDSPHAKISSDLISSIFLNYNSKRSVMEISIPVAVKFLNKGNKELSRNLASYLSLIAIEHSQLLSPHIDLILNSILTDNYGLSRILLSLYEINSDPIIRMCSELVEIVPKCDTQEQLTLLQLFATIAKVKPSALHGSLYQLCDLIPNPELTHATLIVLLRITEQRPLLILEYRDQIRRVTTPQCMSVVAQILSATGKLGKEHAQVALDYVLEQLPHADRATHSILLEEARKLCTQYPALFTEKVTAVVRQRNILIQQQANGHINKTSGGITIVKLNQAQTPVKPQVLVNHAAIPTSQQQTNGVPHTGYTRRAKLGDSRSTGRLHSGGGGNTRSMTRLNIGSVGGLHKSMTRLSSSQHINQPPNGAHSGQTISQTQNVIISGAEGKWAVPILKSGNVTVTTSPTKPRPYSTGPLGSSNVAFYKLNKDDTDLSSSVLNQSTGSISLNTISVHHATPASPITVPIVPLTSMDSTNQVSVSGPSTEVTRRFENRSITLLNAAQRGSVFEPYPMRDTIQHFCEKHLDKIKSFTKNISRCLPPPAKCTIEERRSKKQAKLHFACQIRGPHCLYSKTFFIMKTKNPKIWIHLMFLDLQSRNNCALSSWDPSVSSLRHCWDTLKCENKTFITLVTSAFPNSKDTDSLLYELRHSGFFDVFELGHATPEEMESVDFHYKWGCFLCNHPEKAMGFLEGNNQPVIEGQLKEKKGKWRLFRRWRTRYFTLSGAHLSCKSGGESIDINQIRSVKVSRGARNIPKAFEIFTGDQTLILKPKDGKNAEEWVQCLSIVVAHSQARDTPPTKTNSLPARSLNRFSTLEG